jgi:hypothetical protein
MIETWFEKLVVAPQSRVKTTAVNAPSGDAILALNHVSAETSGDPALCHPKYQETCGEHGSDYENDFADSVG